MCLILWGIYFNEIGDKLYEHCYVLIKSLVTFCSTRQNGFEVEQNHQCPQTPIPRRHPTWIRDPKMEEDSLVKHLERMVHKENYEVVVPHSG